GAGWRTCVGLDWSAWDATAGIATATATAATGTCTSATSSRCPRSARPERPTWHLPPAEHTAAATGTAAPAAGIAARATTIAACPEPRAATRTTPTAEAGDADRRAPTEFSDDAAAQKIVVEPPDLFRQVSRCAGICL